MNIYAFPPIAFLIRIAEWSLTHLSDLLAPSVGDVSTALAVVLLTVLVRLLLVPVGVSQMRAALTRERLAPRLGELQRRYGGQREVLQRKTLELYSEEGASPAAGCLPALAQMPVLMAIYGLFVVPSIDGVPNPLLTQTFMGVELGTGFAGILGGGGLTATTVLAYLVIVAVIVVVAHFSRRVLMPQLEQAGDVRPQADPRTGGSGPAVPDMRGLMRAMSFMPFMTAVIALFVPLAAALYLMTSTAWTLGERILLRRLMAPQEG
ncbi:YidC/Oxa1 family membrane protein insertase [Brevibacterium album]|uniref:YidC/Oxa1 family membrane protein insertase n=1 Tax=Brevibacterium album TaxID=417948 RepID=UPI0003FA9521|nr:membrane protein insertase YidC [Brevibacterium album]